MGSETNPVRYVEAWGTEFPSEEDFAGLCERTEEFSEYVTGYSYAGDRFEDEPLFRVEITRVPVAA